MSIAILIAGMLLFGTFLASWWLSSATIKKILDAKTLILLFFDEIEKIKNKKIEEVSANKEAIEKKLDEAIAEIENRLEKWDFENERKLPFFRLVFKFADVSRKKRILEEELEKELEYFEKFADLAVGEANKTMKNEILQLIRMIEKTKKKAIELKDKCKLEQNISYLDKTIKNLDDARAICENARRQKGEKLFFSIGKIKNRIKQARRMQKIVEDSEKVYSRTKNIDFLKLEFEFKEWLDKIKNSFPKDFSEFKKFIAECEIFLNKFKEETDENKKLLMASEIMLVLDEKFGEKELELCFIDFDLFRTVFLKKLKDSNVVLSKELKETFYETHSNILNLEEFRKRLKFVKSAIQFY